MTNSKVTDNAPVRRSGFGWLTVMLIALAGVYSGARWHASIGPWFRMSDSDDVPVHDPEQNSATELWTCSMHPQVIQEKPGLCPICHMQLTPLKVDAAQTTHGAATEIGGASTPATIASGTGARSERKVKYWWDPMLSPPYISDKPGKSPMGMDLIPVYEDEASAGPGPVTIDPVVVQNMGVRVAMVTEAPLEKSVRLVGYLDEAEPNIRDINLRVSGWIRRLYANTEGQHVEAGDPLFDLYSPELQVAVEELIAARRAMAAVPAAGESIAAGMANDLYDASAAKLELLGLDRRQIDALAKNEKAPDAVTFTSPVMGHVTEKPAVEGAAVHAGDKVLRIVDHGVLWLDAQVFEKDLPFVTVGQKVSAMIASRSGEPVEGEIVFIHPHVDMTTRTVLVRMSIPNPSLAFKPGMYATVRFRSRIRDRAVIVPREAIIDTGDSQIAFVAQAVGRFEPRTVKMGLAAGDGMVEVQEGLVPGEAVVTSGQFLLDTESRLREAIQKYLNQKREIAEGKALDREQAPAATKETEEHAAEPAEPKKDRPAVTAAPEELKERQTAADAVVSAYLELSAALGAAEPPLAPLDPGTLVVAAHRLHGAVVGSDFEPLAVDLAKEAEALRDQPLDDQRELFKTLSAKVIALVDVVPPSAAVGDTLYEMECLMAGGDWLQTTPDIANPFYASEMKECGTVVRTLPLRGR